MSFCCSASDPTAVFEQVLMLNPPVINHDGASVGTLLFVHDIKLARSEGDPAVGGRGEIRSLRNQLHRDASGSQRCDRHRHAVAASAKLCWVTVLQRIPLDHMPRRSVRGG